MSSSQEHPESQKIAEEVSSGDEAAQKGLWREARAHFMSALQLDNQAADVWVKFGRVVEKGATAAVKWSGQFGQRAKVYPTRANGYENDKATELF